MRTVVRRSRCGDVLKCVLVRIRGSCIVRDVMRVKICVIRCCYFTFSIRPCSSAIEIRRGQTRYERKQTNKQRKTALREQKAPSSRIANAERNEREKRN